MPTYARLATLTLLLALSLLATACIGTSAPSHFYVLEPVTQQTSDSSDLVVVVDPLRFPAVLDRAQIVTVDGRHERHLDEFARWAEPFGANVSACFAEDLARQLGSSHVSVLPLRMASSEDVRVTVEILSFQATLGGGCALDALWVLHDAAGHITASGRATSTADTDDDDYTALVAAMSRCVGGLAGQVAAAIEAAAAAPDTTAPAADG